MADFTYGSQNDLELALKEIGPWTDIFSLGATMYNLLTGSIPPSSNKLYQDGRDAFVCPKDVSSSIKDIIIWMMKPNKDDRQQTIQVVNSLIGKIQQGSNQKEQNDNSSAISSEEEETQMVDVHETQNQQTNNKNYKKQGQGRRKLYYWICGLFLIVLVAVCTILIWHLSQKPSIPPKPIDNATKSVDLGLTSGTIWADRNIGAPSPSDFGDLYAWGEVSKKKNIQK